MALHPTPKPRKRLQKKFQRKVKRHRSKCVVCFKGYLADRKTAKFCSKQCGRAAYEFKSGRNPVYRPGGSAWKQLDAAAPGLPEKLSKMPVMRKRKRTVPDLSSLIPASVKAKPTTLLKGDILAP